MTPVPETAAARQRDVLEVLDALPPGTRTKDDIDRQMADERASWTEPLTVALEAPHELSQTLPIGNPAVNISDLTPQQRLELIEQLWDSLTPDEVPLTPAQSAELQRRLDRLDREGSADEAGTKSSAAFVGLGNWRSRS